MVAVLPEKCSRVAMRRERCVDRYTKLVAPAGRNHSTPLGITAFIESQGGVTENGPKLSLPTVPRLHVPCEIERIELPNLPADSDFHCV
jgi:hypothetical protein